MVLCSKTIACGCSSQPSHIVRAPSVESIPYSGSHDDSTTTKHSRTKHHNQKRSKSLDKRFNRYVEDDSNDHLNFKDLLKAINRVGHSHGNVDKNISPKKVKLMRKENQEPDGEPRVRSYVEGSISSTGLSDRSTDSPSMVEFSNSALKSAYYLGPRGSRASAPIAPHYNESLDTMSSYGDDFQNELNNYQESLKQIEHLATSQTYPYISAASLGLGRNSKPTSSSLTAFNNFNAPRAVIDSSAPVLNMSASNASNNASEINVMNSSKSSPLKTLKSSTNRLFKPNSFLGGSFMSLQAYPRRDPKDASSSKQRSNLSLNIQHLNSETISNALLNSVKQSNFSLTVDPSISLMKCDSQPKFGSITSLASNKYPSLKSFLDFDDDIADLTVSKTFSEISQEPSLINLRDTPLKQSVDFASIDRKLFGGSSELSMYKQHPQPSLQKFKIPSNALASSAQTLSCLSTRDMKRELRNRQNRESIIHRNALSISTLSPGILNRTHNVNKADVSKASSNTSGSKTSIGTVIGNPYSVDSSLSQIDTRSESESIQKIAPLAAEFEDAVGSNVRLESGYLGSISTLGNFGSERSETLSSAQSQTLAITTWENLEEKTSSEMFPSIDSDVSIAQNSYAALDLHLAKTNPPIHAISQSDLMKFESQAGEDLLGEIAHEMDQKALREAINSRQMEEMICNRKDDDNLSLMMPYIDDIQDEESSTLCKESELETDTIADSCSIHLVSERSEGSTLERPSDESSSKPAQKASSSSWHLFSKSVSVQLSCVPGMDYLQALDSPTLAFMAYYSFLPVLHDTCVSLTIVPKKISHHDINMVQMDHTPYSSWEEAILCKLDEPVDMHLTKSQLKVAEEYKDWLRANLEPVLAFNIWACEDNFSNNTKQWCAQNGANFWNRASDKSRAKILAALDLDSTEGTFERLRKQALLCFQLVDGFYQDRRYFFGDRPSSVDAEVFGFLAPIYFGSNLKDQTFRNLLTQWEGITSLLEHLKDRIDLMDSREV